MAAVTLHRIGDFYEAFGDDARVVAKTIGLTITTRCKGGDETPMCGLPYHQLDAYVGKLFAAGLAVSVLRDGKPEAV